MAQPGGDRRPSRRCSAASRRRRLRAPPRCCSERRRDAAQRPPRVAGAAQPEQAPRVDGTSDRRRAARLRPRDGAHSLRGKLVLPCADVATVGQLKAQVADRLGLDLDNLALFHRSKALRDDDDAVDAGMRFYAAYCSPASRGRGGPLLCVLRVVSRLDGAQPGAARAHLADRAEVVRPARARAHPPQRRVHVLHLARRRPDRGVAHGLRHRRHARRGALLQHRVHDRDGPQARRAGRRPRQVRVPPGRVELARRPRRRRVVALVRPRECQL